MIFQVKGFDELSGQELYDILQLRSEVFVVEQNCVYNDLDGLDKEAVHLFVTKGRSVAGAARILPGGTRFQEVSIGRVVVSKDFRGHNLGRRIMQEAIAVAVSEFNAAKIKISAQLYLEQFYGSLGFSTITDVYDEDGIPHVGMLWQQK